MKEILHMSNTFADICDCSRYRTAYNKRAGSLPWQVCALSECTSSVVVVITTLLHCAILMPVYCEVLVYCNISPGINANGSFI